MSISNNLMLNKKVLNAVKKGKFRIFAIKHVNEALEVLTGEHPGHISNDGQYPAKSLFGVINQKLNDLRETDDNEDEAKEKKGKKES